MRKAFTSLSRRQALVLTVLFLGDVAVLAAGFLIVRQPAPIEPPVPVISAASCQALAAEKLAALNLAGVAQLDPDGAVRLELSGRDLSGDTLPRAIEGVWEALAAAAALAEADCGPYRSVRVDVPDWNGPPGAHLLVEVNWIDLRAWGERELDDGELAARSNMTTYILP
jgi:hypothetical protein